VPPITLRYPYSFCTSSRRCVLHLVPTLDGLRGRTAPADPTNARGSGSHWLPLPRVSRTGCRFSRTPLRGGGGNRTRVLRRFNRTSPGAVRVVSTRPHPVMHTSRCDRPSRCELSRPYPRPIRVVSHLADARNRAGDTPGLTDLLVLPRQQERSRRDSRRRLFFVHRFFNEVSNAILGPLLLSRQPESRPFTPWTDTHRMRVSMSRLTRGER